MDQPGSGGVLLDFLAQPKNIDVDCAIGDCAVLSPDSIEQLLAAENHARPGHQELQQPEFGGSQREALAAQFHLAAAAIQFEAAGFQQAGGRGLGAELQLDARDQFADEKRLDDVIVGAQFQTDDAVGFGGAAR